MKKPTRTILFTLLALGSSNVAKAGEKCTLQSIGTASVYAWRFHNQTTSNGEKFSQDGFTVAHPSLPFGTKVRLVDENTGEEVNATVNDRGPYSHHMVDVSVAIWGALGHDKGERHSDETLGVADVRMFRCRPT